MFGFIRDARNIPPESRPAGDFLPGSLRLLEQPPSPIPRRLLYWLLALLVLASLWLVFGRLDIVAVADGKLAPRTSLKIVQPTDPGTVAEILVTEGETVLPGQLLLRLDPELQQAETRALQGELALRTLQLRRVDAELADRPLQRQSGDSTETFARTDAQYRANRAALQDALAQESSALTRTTQDLRAAMAVQDKLRRTVPIYQTMAARYATLQSEGYVSELFALERQRDRIEKEQDLAAQNHTVESLRATLAQALRRLAQVDSTYRQQLHAERAQAAGQRGRTEEELAKQLHRAKAVELRAPQSGIVKDLATHTIGTVVSPGTVLLTLVPIGEELQADVLVRQVDAGFVHLGQRARIKLVSYPFQKYGLLEGTVVHVSPDASENTTARRDSTDDSTLPLTPNGYRVRIDLAAQSIGFDGHALPLSSGMQAAAEIRLGDRTLLEYLLAPVQKAWHEAARER
ncbi:MAG: HlyD family type I secretion periplasmic adaptor subunit [Betaproteobacteria bacterium]